MKVTRILRAKRPNKGKVAALREQARRLGQVRSDVWQRFGSLHGVGLSDRQIRDAWLSEGRVFPVSANAWKETLRDAKGDITATMEAAKVKARRCILRHTQDKSEQKRLFTALKGNDWTHDPYLRRVMRKYWVRGHNHTHNQIIVRSDNYTTFHLGGRVWIKIPGLVKGQRIAIPLDTTVAPTGTLRIILTDDDRIEVHYAIDAEITQDCGMRTIGADKGYSEVLVDSDGDHHGQELGQVLTDQSDRLKIKHEYTDDADRITTAYHEAKKDGTLPALPPELAPHAEQVFKLIDSVFSESQLPEIGDDRKPKKNPLNANFEKQEFKELWNRINRKAAYSVDFDSDELVQKAVKTLNDKDAGLRVTPLQYTIQHGEQAAAVTYDGIKGGNAFDLKATETETNRNSIHSAVKYDLVGKLAEGTQLTRRTVAEVLKGINVAVFAQFKTNPESFIAEATRLINEQKATVIIEHLAYDPVEDKFDLDIFTAGQTKQDFSNAVKTPRHHIYDFVLPDSGSKPERDFAEALEASAEVVVYAKLPRGFLIPTPVGDYNPDWAISFKEGAVKHIYFVAETKGSMSSMDLREIEKTKIKCARKFFDEMNRRFAPENVKYDVVDSFGRLMELVK